MGKIGEYTIPNFNIHYEFNDLQKFVYLDKYSVYRWDLGRRETWAETVARSVDILRYLSKEKLAFKTYQDIFDAIYKLEVLPSMRLFSMPLDAVKRCNTVLYNCSYLGISRLKDISTVLYLSMSGCGVGYSVEKHFINKLPSIEELNGYGYKIVVEDTQMGWAESFETLLIKLFKGYNVEWDLSKLRPAGAPLITKGGYSSGPEPLDEMFRHTRDIITSARGRQLTTLEVHDIVTKIADCAVSGASRRSALIALFDADDNDMLTCKYDGFYDKYPWRVNANNSAVWTDDISRERKVELLEQLFDNGSGEPGIFHRSNAFYNSPLRRKSNEGYHNEFKEGSIGTNPCGEIILRNKQFCNLSSIVVRESDTVKDLYDKTIIATIIGTIQSMATSFKYIDMEFKNNSEEERLLGVNIIGFCDLDLIRDERILTDLKNTTIGVNRQTASMLHINPSAAITAMKPSGNSSALTNAGPGVNPHHYRYSSRNVVVNKNTAIYRFMESNKVPMTQHPNRESDVLAHFPVSVPKNALTLERMSALEQCENWRIAAEYYCEHNPSVSIQYHPHEIQDLIEWVMYNESKINGMAFFPVYESSSQYLPIQPIDKEEFVRRITEFPILNWDNMIDFESGKDEKQSVMECAGGQCDIIY